jgi:hypothetical protein
MSSFPCIARWRFTGIAADSVTWRAETALDGGSSWHFDQANAGRPSEPA